MTDFASILQDFAQQVVPRLRSRLQFQRKLAKGGTKPDGTPFINKRTGQPYMATTQLSHVLVGLTTLTRLLTYLQQRDLLPEAITPSHFRRVCVLFSLHDLHKDDEIKREVQKRDTSIKPAEMVEIADKVGLTEWLGADDLNGYEYREAMIHLSDATHGDRKHCRGEIAYDLLYDLVRLADAMASVQSLEEGTKGLGNRLKDLGRSLKHLQFFYHKIDDYRGLTTNFYHQAIAKTLQREYDLYPLLFFENGTVYLGQTQLQSFNRDEFLKLVAQEFNNYLQQLGKNPSTELEYNPKTQRFEKYIFAFSSVAKLLEFLKNNSIRKTELGWFQGNPDKPEKDYFIQKRFKGKIFPEAFGTREKFLDLYEITNNQDLQEDFAQKWYAVSQYLGGVLNLLRDVYLTPDENWEKVVSWLGERLGIPQHIQTNVIQHSSVFNQAGTPEFSHILAYHYLNNFEYQGQSASTVPVQEILNILNKQLLPDITALDSIEKRQNYVEDELAFNYDIQDYLDKNLVLSWEQERKIEVDPLKIVAAKNKTRSPAKLCSLCNRVITNKMNLKSAPIKATIIEDGIKEFSNRLLPKSKDVSSRLWCPQCYLEWMSRKLAGLGYAPGADNKKSGRLYFFILPNPVLTPEMLDVLRERLEILRKGTSVTVKQYGKDGIPSIPRVWLKTKDITTEGKGEDWLSEVLEVLAEEATRKLKSIEEKGKRMAGERIVTFSFFDDDDMDFDDEENDEQELEKSERLPSNFLIVTLEASRYSSKKSEAITQTELWMRGLLTALVLQDLLGMRVYLTDKPYLPVAYLNQVNEALEVDGEHIALRSLFTSHSLSINNQLSLRGITVDLLLDRLAALWVVNEGLNDDEKGIARCLGEVNRNELAGARFFADYQRKLDDNSKGKKDSYIHVSPTLFNQACHLILDSFEQEANGYSMTLKNLAETIATQSLDLFLPITPKDGTGKANRYEKPYRSAISALKQVSRQPDVSTEEMIAHIAGTLLKQLPRLDTGISFPFNWKDAEKNQLAQTFAQTIVVNLFQERCQSSFSRLSRYENDLANGVFFYISEHLEAKWKQFKKISEQRKQEKDNKSDN